MVLIHVLSLKRKKKSEEKDSLGIWVTEKLCKIRMFGIDSEKIYINEVVKSRLNAG